MSKEVSPNFKEMESRPLWVSLGFVSNDSQTWHISADSNLVYDDKKKYMNAYVYCKIHKLLQSGGFACLT